MRLFRVRALGRAGLALACVMAVVATVPATVPAAAASGTGAVHGSVVTPGRDRVPLTVRWFTRDWQYLGTRKLRGGLYSLRLAPGQYRLQFVDRRPSYDVTKLAPADASVTVRAGRTTVRNVRMHRGAAITGKVRAHGAPAKRARVVAAHTDGRSFDTIANGKGEFALGGLPKGSYSVFTYDRAERRVARSTWLPGLRPRRVVNTVIKLNKRAGKLLVDVYAGGQPVRGRVPVTVISRRTGQFWSTTTRQGTAAFPAVFPGRYKAVVGGAGEYFGAKGPVAKAKVKAGRVSFGSFRLTRRGAAVAGTVVDGLGPTYRLRGAQVQLFDRFGRRLGTAATDGAGRFRIGGQIGTQAGATLVVAPNPASGGWMQAAAYCRYRTVKVGGIGLVSGRTRELGAVRLPHVIDAQTSVPCGAPEPDPGPPETDPGPPETDPASAALVTTVVP